jgi:pyruvate dehydrogenase E2 component (dihydrolipoamide acetyltransferase)
MKEGRVVSWLKSEGEAISAGEAIMVVESDKADMDVEAFEDGFLAKIIVGEGEMAPVGEPVALIAAEESEIAEVIASFASGGSASSVAAPAAAAEPAAADPTVGTCCVPIVIDPYSWPSREAVFSPSIDSLLAFAM